MQGLGWGINIGIIILAVSVGRALASTLRFRGRVGSSLPATGTDPELARTVEELQGRVAELEERLDFTERMLATQREGARLGAPKEGARA